MLDLYPVHRKQIDYGNFPLNHDAILKVEYYPQSGLHYQYFTCKAPDTGTLADILCKLFCVRRIYISSVDELSNDF